MSERENEGLPGNSLKYEKSMTRMSQRGSHAKMKSRERLSDGAGVKKNSRINANKSSTDINAKVTPVMSGTLRAATDPEGDIKTVATESRSHVEETITGDKKVNEIIDYVIQNLQEAGKALASLGDNFEHDLKLMFIEIMGKVQNWVSLAQIRLDTAKTDLNSLRRELISRSNELASRDREITDLRTKLIDSEATRDTSEKTVSENVQRSGGTMTSPSTMNFVPARQPMPISALPADSGGQPMSISALPADSRGRQTSISALPAVSGDIALDPSGRSAIQSGIPSNHPNGAETIQSEGIMSNGLSAGAGGTARPAGAAGTAWSAGPGGTTGSAGPGGTARSSGPGGTTWSAGPGGTGIMDQQYSEDTPAEVAHIKSQQARGISGIQNVPRPDDRTYDGIGRSTVDAAVQSGKSKERSKRELELESELLRLRKENEKITKERTDYENAIQRALLRGVSSLNAETLKVLRCAPVGCYTPCGPPPSPVNTL